MSEQGKGEEHFRAWVQSELAACGVATETVSIQYENELQDFSIRIQGAAPTLDSSQLACIARLALTGLIISFEDSEAEAKFRLAAQLAFRAKTREDALVWLAERSLLEGLPVFDPDARDLASYAKASKATVACLPGQYWRSTARTF